MTSEQNTEGVVQYRTRDSISQDALELLLASSKTRTDIFYTLRLSYPQIRKLEDYLTAHGLATIAGTEYRITEKGRAYVKALQKAEAILKGAAA